MQQRCRDGKEFTDRPSASLERERSGNHEFDRLCAELAIEHRMVQRWVASSLSDACQRFRALRGLRDMPQLIAALKDRAALPYVVAVTALRSLRLPNVFERLMKQAVRTCP